MKTRRTEVSFESREVWLVQSATSSRTRQCPFCPDAPMILAEDLARRDQMSPREIYRELERGHVHFVESTNAEVFVCLSSFSLKKIRSEESR